MISDIKFHRNFLNNLWNVYDSKIVFFKKKIFKQYSPRDLRDRETFPFLRNILELLIFDKIIFNPIKIIL